MIKYFSQKVTQIYIVLLFFISLQRKLLSMEEFGIQIPEFVRECAYELAERFYRGMILEDYLFPEFAEQINLVKNFMLQNDLRYLNLGEAAFNIQIPGYKLEIIT